MKSNIEFIEYDGEYPCLCMGTLKVKIDGKEIIFSNSDKYWKYDKNKEKPIFKENCYPKFWCSGGTIKSNGSGWKIWAEKGEWELSAYRNGDYPKEILDILDDLIKVFNENVLYGCCGGCI